MKMEVSQGETNQPKSMNTDSNKQLDVIHGLLLLRILRDAGLNLREDGHELVVRGTLTREQGVFIRRYKDLIRVGLAVEAFEPSNVYLATSPTNEPGNPPTRLAGQPSRPSRFDVHTNRKDPR